MEEIYPAVAVGTSVTIIGTPFGAPGVPPTVLKHGDQGPGVLEVQRSLKRLGYLKWNPDGFWGEGTEKEPMQRWPCKDTYILYIVSLHDFRRKSHSQPYSHKGLRVYY